MKLRKILCIGVAVLMVILALASCGGGTKITVNLVINGTEPIFNAPITVTTKNPTVLDVLEEYSSSQTIELTTGDQGFITSIDGVNAAMTAPTNADGSAGPDYSQYYWKIQINGTDANTGASLLTVKDGDTVQLDFIQFVDTSATTTKS